jgi:predicted ATP-grasp superfamily ATP-dependent carboligase|tara:strand:- start:870 stop:1043 length:174 start_codon:yes stop_codon:yes gene_type:complete
MEKIIISIVAAVLIGLGTWNLNQTFNLSIEVATMKTQIEMITKDLKKIKSKKKKKND